MNLLAADPADPPILLGDGTIGTPFATGNNGLLIAELASDVRNPRIEGLVFRALDRSIAIGPAVADSGIPCATVAPGHAHGVTVRGCRFEASRRGVQSFGGQVENLAIVDNVFTGVAQPIIIAGGSVPCIDPPGFFAAGRSRSTRVVGNEIEVVGTFGILADGAIKVSIRDNVLTGGLIGIAIGDSSALTASDDGPIAIGHVIGNELSDHLFFAIYGFGPTTLENALIANNAIADTTFSGIALDTGANHFQVSNNDISGVLLRADFGDINLGDMTVPPFGFPPATFENTVITTDHDTIVKDGGIDNRILGTSAND